MANQPVLVRWFEEAYADCLRSDGVGNYTCSDFSLLSFVFVAASPDDAFRLIEGSVERYDDQGEEIDTKPEDWRWEQPEEDGRGDRVRWDLYFRNDYAATAYFAPLEIQSVPLPPGPE